MSRIEELEKRLAADPNSRIFVQLAEEYRKQGLLENAIEVCEEGLKKHPQYPSARVALGRALLEAESFDRASEEFETVLAQVPDNILANKFLGETYHRLGRFDEAIQKYQIAQTLAPEDTELEDRIQSVKGDMAGGAPAPVSPAPEAADETVMAPPGAAALPPLPPPPPPAEGLEPTLVDAQSQEAPPARDVPPPPVPQSTVPPAAPEASTEPEQREPEEEPEPEPNLAPIPLVAVDEPMVLEGPAYRGVGESADDAEAPESAPPPPELVSPFDPAPQQEQVHQPEPPSSEDMASPPDVVSPFEAVQEQERVFEAPVYEAEQVFEAPPEPPVAPSPPPAAPPTPEAVVEEPPQPPAPEPPSAPPPPPAVPDEIETPTMAELYANQGHFDRAIAVYRNLLARTPNETHYLQRIEELELLQSAAATPSSQAPAAARDAHGDDQTRQKTIEVLEQWLEAIRGSRRS